MKKGKQTLISFLLVIVLLTLSVSPIAVADNQVAFSKISDELLIAFQNAANSRSGNDTSIDVVIWIEDNATTKYHEAASKIQEPSALLNNTRTASDLKDSITSTKNTLKQSERLAQIEEIQNHIMQKRQAAEAIYLEENAKIADELPNTEKIVYISKYSPLIICNLTYDETLAAAKKDSVKRIEYGESEIHSEMAVTTPMVGIDESSEYFSDFTAEGIKIGMVEPGVPDLSYPCFNNIRNKITILDTASNAADDIAHASQVAAIMVGNQSGIAKNFEHLYCIGAVSSSEFYENVETLLSNGVNVINMSAGTDDSNIYDETCKWVDHIAYNHSVHFIKSAGNKRLVNGDIVYGVTIPGMSHNAITVGNVQDPSGSFCNSSAYNENTPNVAFKPDISAPGCTITIPNADITYTDSEDNIVHINENEGTSFSAPHVTAITAVLCSYYPTLMTKQALMKSILMSSVSKNNYYSWDTQFLPNSNPQTIRTEYKRLGSGIINAHNAMVLIDSGNFITGSITSSENFDVFSIGNLTAGQKVTVTLTFLKRNRFRTSEHLSPDDLSITATNADLDLYVTPVATYLPGACTRESTYKKSITTNNYTEKIIYTSNTNGEFLVCVNKEQGHDPYEIIYAVSWMVHSDDIE